MTETEKLIAMIKVESDVSVKAGIAAAYLTAIERRRVRIKKEDKLKLGEFAIGELETLIDDIRSAESYKEKVALIRYEDTVIGFLILCYKYPQNVPEEKQSALRELSMLVENERKLENGVTDLFAKQEITSEDVLDLLETLTTIKDEYHRGAFYAGFLHYSSSLKKLDGQPKALISRFLEAELDRYISKKDSLTEDEECNLEYIVDLVAHFLTDRITEQLTEVLTFASKEVRLFTIKSLAQTDSPIPEEMIVEMAKDVSCAVVLFLSLKKVNKTDLIPEEYRSEEYIARSDMTRWLEYPTELGKMPDELECLGKTVFKKSTFFVFRFRSDSENLEENQRGKWLICCSAPELGIFSPFAEYEKYQKKTPEKTLKHIIRKLIKTKK